MKFLFLLLLFAANVVAQKRTNFEKGFSYFLAGDTKTAHAYLTKGIAADTLVYEAYYFRGIISLWENDTLATIHDFDQTLRLKSAGRKPCNDSLLNVLMQQKPQRPLIIDSFQPNVGLFDLQVATWHTLEEIDQERACKLLKAAVLEIKAAGILQKWICQ